MGGTFSFVYDIEKHNGMNQNKKKTWNTAYLCHDTVLPSHCDTCRVRRGGQWVPSTHSQTDGIISDLALSLPKLDTFNTRVLRYSIQCTTSTTESTGSLF